MIKKQYLIFSQTVIVIRFCWKSWAKCWGAMTGFNIREESYIHESILFVFPGSSNDAIAINYCVLYAKHYIYLEKNSKKKIKKENLTQTFWGICSISNIYTHDGKKVFLIEKSNRQV